MLLAAGVIAIGVMSYAGLPTAWLRRGVLHVAPDGSNLLVGSSRRWAVRTLARAVDLAAPGETILLWPGVYRETVHLFRGGLPGRPLRIRAALPGQAVISGAAPGSLSRGWQWWKAGRNLHTTATPWLIQALRVDDWAAFRAQSLAELQELCRRPLAWPAFHASRRGPRLWLCLPDGSSPAQHTLTVHRAMPERTRAGGHQSASLWVAASHLEIRDLHFDFAVGAAIQLWDASDVHLAHNLFTGTDVGINANPHRSPPARLIVQHNAFHHAPQYQWRGWLSWQELYRYSNSSLLWLGGRDLSVAHNLVSQAGDGLKLMPSAGNNRVWGNLIANSTDDALELDGTSGALSIEGNLIANSFANLSVSPLPSQAITIRDNLFLNGPNNGHNTWLKLLGHPIHPLRLERNLVLAEWLGWYDGGQTSLRLQGTGNQLLVRHRFGPAPLPAQAFLHNQVLRTIETPWPEPSAGPGALPHRPSSPRLQLSSIGPCWLQFEASPAWQGVPQLLNSGWIKWAAGSPSTC